MVIDLSKITFQNDFFFVSTKDGGSITLNRINETIDTVPIQGISILFQNERKNIMKKCVNVIGMENDIIRLYSRKEELQGKALTEEYLSECFLEIFENDEEE